MSEARDQGVVLVNVLVILAVAAGLVYLMLGSQDAALDRIRHVQDAVQAEQLALGAEASVIAALRRDLDTGPGTDHFAEPWAAIQQDEVVLSTGRFSVSIEDVQAKYDINLLADGSVGARAFARRLLGALDLPASLADQIAAILGVTGPVSDLIDLAAFGIPEPALERMAEHVTALPVGGSVNLNTATPLLIDAMLQNRGLSARLVALRAREGQITRAGLEQIGVLRPENSGFTSNVFDVEILAEVGAAQIRLRSRLVRINELTLKAVTVQRREFLSDGGPPPER